MKLLALICIVVIAVFLPKWLSNYRIRAKGREGERRVASKLGKTKNGKKYMINNLVIRTSHESTIQIDHIFINCNGIWVIETKNYAGMINGNDFWENWTQTLAYGKVKNKFFNPVKQNEIHIRVLRHYLGEDAPLNNIVVFADPNTEMKYVESKNAVLISRLKNTVWKPNNLNLSVEKMEHYYSILIDLKKQAPADKEHTKNMKKRGSRERKGLCPRCGGELVEKEGEYGKFLGCSNYPNCKYTKKK